MKARTAWNVESETCAAPPAPAGAGCQSKKGVLATSGSVAKRYIGFSGTSGPTGEVTLTMSAAIVRKEAVRRESGAYSKRVSLFTQTNDTQSA